MGLELKQTRSVTFTNNLPGLEEPGSVSVEVELPAVQDQQVAGRVLLVQGLPRLDFRTFGGIGRQQSFVREINRSEELVINIGRWSMVKRTAKID